MKRLKRRASPCGRRPLAREIAGLRRDFERIEVDPDFERRVRAAVRRERRSDGSLGRLAAVAALALLSLVGSGGSLDPFPRPLASASMAAPTPRDARDVLTRLASEDPGARLAALSESAALLPHPPGDVVSAWRRLAKDADPAVRASAQALLASWQEGSEGSR
jgi:hypothetical protein